MVLFLQETKLEDAKDLKAVGNFWRESSRSIESSRGASGGLGIFWLNENFTLVEAIKTKSWIIAHLEEKE